MTELTAAAVMEQLDSVCDPEIGYSIVGLGLVYEVQINAERKSSCVRMTLTSPACPLADYFRQSIEQKLRQVWPDWKHEVEFTFEPPWSPQKIGADIKELLKISGLPLQ